MSPLQGIRVWLCGSVPEADKSTATERETIAQFVRLFSSRVYKLGGHVIHGSHPSFSPILIETAKRFQEGGGHRDSLTLVVSRHWSKNMTTEISGWRKTCLVYETPEKVGHDPRSESLKILREWMAARCDAVVVVGGKWWERAPGSAGIPEEIELAVERGITSFLLGGAGGKTREFVEQNPHVLRALKNGFDDVTNKALASQSNPETLTDRVCQQLERLPLIRGEGSSGVAFRILALDGGGIKGTFTAAALATWEEQTNLQIAEHFDLIAGTSTGGILAIGLGLGLPASKMLDFYKNSGPKIFPNTSMASRYTHRVRHFFRPKYSRQVLLRELEKGYYGNGPRAILANSKCRLVIPAYHAIAGASHLFRTPHHPLLVADAKFDAATVALATAAAPTYFSAAKVGNMIAESQFFDGGVWANSPAMAAIIEATSFLKIPLDRIDVLSVGTTEEPFTVRTKASAGVARWNVKLLELLMHAQAESSLRQAKELAGTPRFLRLNAITPRGTYSLDNPKNITELASLGNREASKPEILDAIRSRFLNGVPVNPWQRFDVKSWPS